MHSFLSQLRRRPEWARRRIVLLCSISITLIIAFFWIASFSTRIAEKEMARAGNGPSKSGPLEELTGAVTLFAEESYAAIRDIKELLPFGKE